MRNKKRLKGFTLIEIVIAIVVMGILAGLSAPKFIGVKRDADVSSMYRDIDTLEKVIPVYYTNNEVYPLMGSELTLTGDIKDFISQNGDKGPFYEVDKGTVNPYVTTLKHNGTFIYSKTTGKVYYSPGLVNGKGELRFTYDGTFTSSPFGIQNVKINNKLVSDGELLDSYNKTSTITGTIKSTSTIKANINGVDIDTSDISYVYGNKDTKDLLFKNVYASGDTKQFKITTTLKLQEKNVVKLEVPEEKKSFSFNVNLLFALPDGESSVTDYKTLTPSCSHDGRMVTYVGVKSGQRNNNVFVKDMLTNTEYSITTDGKGDYSSPMISGNGKYVVYILPISGTVNYNIYGYDIENRQEFLISNATGIKSCLNISYNGNIITWSDKRSTSLDIYGYNLTTKKEFVIKNDSYHQCSPCLSSDGKMIMWSEDRSVSGKIHRLIYTKNIETGEEKQVFDVGENYSYRGLGEFKLSGNGRVVLWNESKGIYGINLDTLQTFTIADNGTNEKAEISYDGNIVTWQNKDYRDGSSSMIPNIFVKNLTTNKKYDVSVTNSSGYHTDAFISGDGRSVYWQWPQGTNYSNIHGYNTSFLIDK